ncbi:hypothetical protein BDZ91DRAFT_790507 [Kalaharituber pfeilii]|nr:hypothetical protein BDZ91DRAFT_790507 [Kalaharituber pfeilii]
MNGGYSPKPPSNGLSRRNSFDNDLEEFGHIAIANGGGDYGRNRAPAGEIALRERELAIRQRELELKEQELMRRAGGAGRGGGGGHGRRHSHIYEDDDDEDDVYYDNSPLPPPVDPDSIDMMSVTSRRTRRVPSAGNMRNMEPGSIPATRAARHPFINGRPATVRNRTSARLVSEIPGLHDNILENPLMGYSSNRYGAVDRKMLHDSSRANSLSVTRLGDIRDDPAFSGLGQRGGPYPPNGPVSRQVGPAPNMRPNGPTGPTNGYSPEFRGRGASLVNPQSGSHHQDLSRAPVIKQCQVQWITPIMIL